MTLLNLRLRRTGNRRESQENREVRACWKPGALIAASTAILTTAIIACGSGGGDSAGNGITADTEIYLANQSAEERGCLEETFDGDQLGVVLQSWAEFILDDSPTATEKLDGTAGLWICGIDEFSTLRAMARSIFPSVPQAEAPGGLSEINRTGDLPVERIAYLDLVDRLPETLDGAARESGQEQEVVYVDDDGKRRFVIEAGDFSDSDYGGEWNAADGLISRLLSPYFVGSEIGVDDGLLWLRFTAPETDAEDARTLHALNWGAADAPIWFQAIAFSVEDADLLAGTFAEAAGG